MVAALGGEPCWPGQLAHACGQAVTAGRAARPARAVTGWPRRGRSGMGARGRRTGALHCSALPRAPQGCRARAEDSDRDAMSAQPTSDQDPHEPYEVIHLGGEAAAIVPLSDLRRLRAVERRVARGEGISTTLHGRSRWDARSWAGCRPVGWLSSGWLRTRTRREPNRCPASTGIAHDVVSRQMHDTAVPPDG